ncbi:MFS transporter [Plantactinospora sp. B6F1]|uniref:MFS transporter n=1 Tax=Plantactinospora sp. B6F1 TaxID=3158971 RepID=UPI0032D8BF40
MSGRRDLRLFGALVAGYTVSTAGTFLNLVAINLYVFQLTASALQTGLLMAARITAGFLAGPVAGWVVVRFERRFVMIASDVTQALAMVTLLVTPASRHPDLLWVVAVALGAGNTFFTVALRTSVPNLVGSADRLRGNGYLVTGKSFAMVLGFASAGPLIGGFGFMPAFGINAGSFLVSALVLAWLPLSFRGTDGGADGGVVSSDEPVGLSMLHRLRLLRMASPVLVGLLGLRGMEALGGASHNVALPAFAQTASPENPAALLSGFWAAWAMGSMAAYQAVARWLKRGGRHLDERAFAGAVCLASLAFVAVFAGLPLPALVMVALVAGLADGLAELAYVTRLQVGSDDTRGLLFGMSATAETLGMAVGMLSSALLLEQMAALPVVGLFHGVLIAVMVAFLTLRPARRRLPTAAET